MPLTLDHEKSSPFSSIPFFTLSKIVVFHYAKVNLRHFEQCDWSQNEGERRTLSSFDS